MSNNRSRVNECLNSSQSLDAGVTAKAVSHNFGISDRGSLNLLIRLQVESATASSGVSAIFQQSPDGVRWTNVKTVAITTTAVQADFFIRMMAEVAADQAYLPLCPVGRIVCTTGSGDAVVFSLIEVIQGN